MAAKPLSSPMTCVRYTIRLVDSLRTQSRWCACQTACTAGLHGGSTLAPSRALMQQAASGLALQHSVWGHPVRATAALRSACSSVL